MASILDAAGFTLKDGRRFSLELTYIATFPFDAVAKSVAAQWTEVEVEVKLAGLDSQIWTDKVYRKNDFDVSVISLTARSDPTLGVDRSFVCNEAHLPYVNPTGYCNPELDRIALQAGTVPADQRRALYKQYAEIVARDLNELTLTNAPTFHAVATKFQNLDALFNIAFASSKMAFAPALFTPLPFSCDCASSEPRSLASTIRPRELLAAFLNPCNAPQWWTDRNDATHATQRKCRAQP